MRRIVHIMPYEKWTQQIMDSNQRNFKEMNHRYYLYSLNPDIEDKVEKVIDESQVIWALGKKNWVYYMQLSEEIRKADKVVFHSLFMSTIMLFVVNLLGIFYRKKYSWFIWGGDVYNELWIFQDNKKNLGVFMREYMRRWYIFLVPEITGNCELDFKYLKKYYFTRAEFIKTFYQVSFLNTFHNKNENEVRILIGNNASGTCQHIESMLAIKPYVDVNSKVYVILSYPIVNKAYKNKVIRIGRRLFGDNFVPITKFVPYEQHIKFISTIDIVVMNQNRQQGISNLINFLHMGTKIYMNPKNTFYYELKLNEGIVFDMQDVGESFLEDLTAQEKENNRIIAEKMNSDSQYREQWGKVYRRKRGRLK